MKLYTRKQLCDSEHSLTYNDIGLVPLSISQIESRSCISLESIFLGKKFSLPIISSPMETVSGFDMCQTLFDNGCLGFHHKNDNMGFNEIQKTLTTGIKTNYLTNPIFIDNSKIEIICVDTANAANKFVIKFAADLKQKFPDVKIIVGNIAHANILRELEKYGIDAVRIGIGSGSMCSTSIQTGVGVGQVSVISSCVRLREELGLNIGLIADGGIRTIGDICKSLALGADMVMLGRILAGTKESPGEVIKHEGKKYKIYRGSASYAVKTNKNFIEGEETLIEYKGSVIKVLQEIRDGLRSCMSYLNISSIKELQTEEVLFTKLSVNSYLERLPKI